MTKLGRNDPCSCGSGQKYKKCCLASAEAVESQYRRQRAVEASLIPRLLEHAFDTFGEDSIHEAWSDFNGFEPGDDDDFKSDEDDDFEPYDEANDPHDPASPMNLVFMPWFLFKWTTFTIGDEGGSIPKEITVAESFLVQNKGRLTTDEIRLIASAICCRFTLCEVIEVKPGIGMRQRDLLRGLEFDVTEHAASQSLRRGDIIYCATTELDGITSNLATGPYSLRPIIKRDVLDLRDWILAESEAKEIADIHLDTFEEDIRLLYLDMVDQMLDPHPDIRNTDNDVMAPQQLYFDIAAADQAFHALKDLAEGVDEHELLDDVEMEEGSLRRAELPWIGGNEQARKRLGGPVLLGNIIIEDREMIVEVNSKERAEQIRKLIEERLRNDATYKTTVLDPLPSLDSIDSELSTAAAYGEATTESVLSLLNDPPPELLARLAESNRKHWEAWFDESIPALNNLSPREAAKTERGRDLLESLLCEYESPQARAPENLFAPDIAALRRELGLKP
ncbi:MAG TPA: SEC-C metal-binding domain-containing protein [Pyrinomonadaceae bacterium]|nr:SEC-C metal-binding domain-containing protein [Pyrinomonadaceae bacterium]